jgi:RsiW-degrading membrane proteinase PrsW (M82 family)
MLPAALAAILPTLLYTLLIWWLDRYEKEPLPLLVAAFLWGSLPAVALTVLFNAMLLVPLAHSPLGPGLAASSLSPLVEEPLKAVALVLLFLFARQEFDGPLDGIVYGALIGFGFSMTENMLYFLAFPAELESLFWLRAVFFGLNHALFTSVVGLGLGAVRYAPQRWLGYVVLPLALLGAILLHGFHNLAVHYQLLGLAFSWAVQFAGVLVIVLVAVLAWRHEQRWMEQELGEEITLGVISASDYAEVIYPHRRARLRLSALLSRGLPHYLRLHQLHHLIIELALHKYRLSIGDRFCHAEERDRLRQEIIRLRRSLEVNDWSFEN